MYLLYRSRGPRNLADNNNNDNIIIIIIRVIYISDTYKSASAKDLQLQANRRRPFELYIWYKYVKINTGKVTGIILFGITKRTVPVHAGKFQVAT